MPSVGRPSEAFSSPSEDDQDHASTHQEAIKSPFTASGVPDRFARKLKSIPGVARVDALTGEYLLINNKLFAAPPIRGLTQRFVPPAGQRGTYLSVIPAVDPLSSRGERLVKDIRSTPAPFAFTVAGLSARLVDTKEAVLSRVPLALGLVAFATFVLLFLMTGSLLIPVKALLLTSHHTISSR